MKKFFKALTIVSFAICAVIFSSVVYGSSSIPDEFMVESRDAIELSDFYSIKSFSDSARVAATQGAVGDSGLHSAQIVTLGSVPVKDVKVTVEKRRYVKVGGEAFGIKLYTKGVIVVGIDSESTGSPAVKAGIQKGDIILKVDSVELNSSVRLAQLVEASEGKPLKLLIVRESSERMVVLTPTLGANGRYKAGLWVRDSSAGIGTVTFFDEDSGLFAGLGHAVCDVDTGEIMPLSQGEAVEADIIGSYKSEAGSPGELCGTFTNVKIGNLLLNSSSGVYGKAAIDKGKSQIPVALEGEVKTGKAQIIATIDGNGPKYYDVEITKIYSTVDSTNRNMVIKVTDKELLKKTGGIVQGMSGSPIIQNSLLVGAVTHVFINDPTKGYAIFASKMVDTLDSVRSQSMKLAS